MPRARKPQVGRPSLSGNGEAVVVKAKVAPAVRDQWQAAAKRAGITLSEWLREAGELALARGSTR